LERLYREVKQCWKQHWSKF